MQRSWDECSQYLEYGPSIAQAVWEWRLQLLQELANFCQSDVSDLAAMLRARQLGTCQVLVQAACLRWSSEPGGSAPVFVAPSMVQRTTAACLRRGLDQTLPLLSLTALAELAMSGLLVLVCLGQDGASANVSLSARAEREFMAVPSLLLFAKFCDAHLLSLVLRGLLKRFHLLSMCFSFTLVLRQFTYRTRFFTRVVLEVCSTAFDYILLPAGELPDPQHRDVTLRILHITLFRSQFRTRAALHRSAPQPPPPYKTEELMQERIDRFVLYFTDPWAATLRHICSELCQCCNEVEAKKMMSAVLVELLQMTLPGVPAENKWASLSVVLAYLSFMILVGGGIVCKAWLAEFVISTLNQWLARL